VTDLTTVELLWLEKRIENRIRFGNAVSEQVNDRRRRVLSFAPGSIFAFVRWASNDFGTVLSRVGQTVCRDQLAITVDKIEMGAAREHDRSGRPLPIWQGCHVIADGEVFLMNWRSADSFDGRYFGALPASAIIGTAEPLWTGEEE